MTERKLAVITGASSGIGFELATLCAKDGFDLVIAADEAEIDEAASILRKHGVKVDAVQCDLAETGGVDRLIETIGRRPVAVLMANAGHGLGHGFLDQDWRDILHVINTNVTGTVYLLHTVARRMRQRGDGKILIVGSIAGFIPGAYQAVYNASKAFLDSFSFAIRAELEDSGVTVTCLMPGATETQFFERAEMQDTKVAQGSKDDPADVARQGYEAMMSGDGDVVTGWQNKLRTAIANVTPAGLLAKQHKAQAAPGSAGLVIASSSGTGPGRSVGPVAARGAMGTSWRTRANGLATAEPGNANSDRLKAQHMRDDEGKVQRMTGAYSGSAAIKIASRSRSPGLRGRPAAASARAPAQTLRRGSRRSRFSWPSTPPRDRRRGLRSSYCGGA